jgi:hypothetical protein
VKKAGRFFMRLCYLGDDILAPFAWLFFALFAFPAVTGGGS